MLLTAPPQAPAAHSIAESPSENTPDIPSSGVFCCCDRSDGGRPTHIVGRRGEHVNLSVARCVCRWISPGYAPASGGHWTGLRSHIVRRWAAQPSVEQTALFSHR